MKIVIPLKHKALIGSVKLKIAVEDERAAKIEVNDISRWYRNSRNPHTCDTNYYERRKRIIAYFLTSANNFFNCNFNF